MGMTNYREEKNGTFSEVMVITEQKKPATTRAATC